MWMLCEVDGRKSQERNCFISKTMTKLQLGLCYTFRGTPKVFPIRSPQKDSNWQLQKAMQPGAVKSSETQKAQRSSMPRDLGHTFLATSSGPVETSGRE